MQLKFHARLFLTVFAASFAATGCSDEEKTIDPEPIPIRFEVKVNDILPGMVEIMVTPSEKNAACFFGTIVKSEFDAFASEAEFFTAEASRIQNLAHQSGMTRETFLKTHAKQGGGMIRIPTAVPLTAHYAYVYAIDSDGKVISSLFKADFTSGEAPRTAPELELTLTPGDASGLDKDIKLTIGGRSKDVATGAVMLITTADLEALLATGQTLESIIDGDKNGVPLTAEELEALISESGWKYTYRNLTPGASYTAIVKVTNAVGSTVRSIAESTLSDAGSDAPPLELSLTRGDREGQNKSTTMTAFVKSTAALAGRYGLFSQSQVEAALEKGYTLSYLIENNGAAFTQEQLDKINTEGFVIDIVELEPNSAHTFIAKVANTGGTTIEKRSAATTTGVGPDIRVSLVPGNSEGKQTDVAMKVTMRSTNVLSGRRAFMLKDDFDKAIDKQMTLPQILDAHGEAFSAQDLAAINGEEGLILVFSPLIPSTAYVFLTEVEDDNGTSYSNKSALTEASSTLTSDLTFTFEVEDLTPRSAILTVIPSNDTEKYYFDYLPVAQYDQKSDAEWIASLIGSGGISADYLSSGIAGYDASWFDMMPLTAGEAYYIYAFGYDEELKTATTTIQKQRFDVPTGKETPTEAYEAWLGTWTVTSTSSEKNGTPVVFDIVIQAKTVNISYTITGWSITSYGSRPLTAALKENGDIRIRNQQEIAPNSTGMTTFVGRYFKPETDKYALVPARIDALIGTLNADRQTAAVNGGTFTIEGSDLERTVTSMDYFNHKTTGSWVGYTALTPYKESGYPVGPYTMTKIAEPASFISSAPAPRTPQQYDHRAGLAKRAAARKASTAARTAASAASTRTGMIRSAVLSLSQTGERPLRTATAQADLTR